MTIPEILPAEFDELENGEPKFGIADGGHTFEIIRQTVSRANELMERDGWTEPFVRVHFLAGQAFDSGELEQVVEALNTSSLYKALLNKGRTAKAVNSLGADTEYWTQAANIILRAKDELLSRKSSS